MFTRQVQAGVLAVFMATGCDATGPGDDAGNGLTYGSPPKPLPALDAVPFDALGGAGRLVFARTSTASASPGGIYVIDAAARTSWGFHGEVYSTPSVSPDGHSIAFATLSRYSGATPNHAYDIFAVDAQGGGLRKLSANEGQDRAPSWTPDGSEIVYYVATGLSADVYRRSWNGDSTTNRRVPLDLTCVHLEGPISVAPAGRFVFEGISCLNTTSPVRASGIFVADADGAGVLRRIGYDLGSSGGVRYHAPAWSPNAAEIAFIEVALDTGFLPTATRVRVMDASDAMVRTIAELPVNVTVPSGVEYSLVWSPDGSRIAFTHQLEPLVTSVYAVRTDGTGLTRVTTAQALDGSLSWSR